MYATNRHLVEDAPREYTEDVDLRTIEWLKKDLERRRDKSDRAGKELVSS